MIPAFAYPSTFAMVRVWAGANRISVAEARKRFAQYAILSAIAGSRFLGSALVFKGGNALDFIWQPNRSTTDLDFSLDMTLVRSDMLDATVFTRAFAPTLAVVGSQLGATFAVHRVRKQPPQASADFVTYTVMVGYALPDETALRARMALGRASVNTIPVEISINEPVCAEQSVPLTATTTLRVSTLEDIVAEKLRALLQQPIRDRARKQDLLDIAVILEANQPLDAAQIASFLQQKAAARNVPVSRAAFHNPEIAVRAQRDYDTLAVTTRIRFIPFAPALTRVLQFIDTLPLPP